MRPILAVLIAATVVSSTQAQSPEQVFEQRILPIFKSPNPSSCVQCHLSAVDLKDYILPSSRDTFLSLRDQKLIDLDNIDKSKILKLIEMGKNEKPRETAIHQKNRQLEYEAFVAWLKSCAADQALRTAPALKPEQAAKPSRPLEVIRHNRKDHLLESFENTIWAMGFRCMNCHVEGSPANVKNVAKFGERVAWMKKGGAEETLNYLLSSKLIDFKNPEKSLILLKGLNEVKHEGGKKFEVGDQGYKGFRSFLEDAAKTKANEYTTADSLPKSSNRVAFGTELWFKLTNTPEAWGGKVIKVDLFAWDEKTKAFEKEPIASTDRKVGPTGRIFQHTLSLYADKDSDRAKKWKAAKPTLDRGKYLVKVYLDANGALAEDWKTPLGEKAYVGQIETTTGEWREGYGAMTVVDVTRIKK